MVLMLLNHLYDNKDVSLFYGAASWNEITIFRINDNCIRKYNVVIYGVKEECPHPTVLINVGSSSDGIKLEGQALI